MRENPDRLITAVEAAQALGISLSTLGRMERKGYLLPYRTMGGHRRYSLTMLHDYLARSRERAAVADDAPGDPFAAVPPVGEKKIPSVGCSRPGAEAEPIGFGVPVRLLGRGSGDRRGAREASLARGEGDAGN